MSYNPLDYTGKTIGEIYAAAEQTEQLLPEYNANVLPGFELQPGDLSKRYMDGFYSYLGDSLADIVKSGQENDALRDREMTEYIERLSGHQRDESKSDFENYLDSLSQLFSD